MQEAHLQAHGMHVFDVARQVGRRHLQQLFLRELDALIVKRPTALAL